MVDYAQQRLNMIENQLRPCEIDQSQLLKAARLVKREEFLPNNLRGLAYIDDHIELDDRHFMMRPQSLMNMIKATNIKPKDRILDVGCTYGYSTSLLSYMGDRVIGLEEQEKFIQEASRLAHDQNANNTKFIKGRYLSGYLDEAPYNVILVQRAYATPPEILIEQLAPEGRLAYVKQRNAQFGHAILLTKTNSHVSETVIDEVCLPFYHETQTGFVL